MRHRLQADMEDAPFENTGQAFQTPAGFLWGWGRDADAVGLGKENWAPGAVFHKVDGAAGAQAFKNVGSKTTSSWKESSSAEASGDQLGGTVDAVSSSGYKVLPATNDEGSYKFGDGTTDLDVQTFLGSAAEYALFDVGNSRVEFAVVPLRFTGNVSHCMYVAGVGTTSAHVIDMVDAYTGMFIETGTYASAASKGVTLTTDNARPVSFLFDDGGAILGSSTLGNYRAVLSRVYLASTQTGQVAIRAIRGQVKAADGVALNIGENEFSSINGVEGYIELTGATGRTVGATTRIAGLHSLVEIRQSITLTTGGKVVGILAELAQATGKTVSGIGSAGILVDRVSSGHTDVQVAWGTGLVIASSACTTGINIGSCTDGLVFTGTYTGNVIDFSDATINPTGSNGPCFIRAGTYASPIDYGADNDQSGMIRLYSTCSGDGTSYDRGLFVCTKTTGAKGAFPVAGLAEANNTGTGPSKLQAAQFIAHLGAGGQASKLATLGGDATAGMYGAWLKIAAGGTCEASTGSRCAPCWIDNQMSGSVLGEEYGIFASTGASRPDAFIGFNTTSSGYTQLFNFDSTFDSGAGTCVTTDAVPGSNQDARIKVYYNGTQYYIPLYR